MLDLNALNQLKAMKQEITESKPHYTGHVIGSGGRFGFVANDEQRVFLSPDEMEKVLPGDEIQFTVNTDDNGKESGEVEKLINSDIDQIVGRYFIKGKGHYIEPDQHGLNRWIFIPPAKRNKAKEGDLVVAKLHQHPFETGNTQAAITSIIGHVEDAGIWHKYAKHQFGLTSEFSESSVKQVEQILTDHQTLTLGNRTDYRELAFVTIDGASTQDMDDALFAKRTDFGWQLKVAIADPASLFEFDSPLDVEARGKGSSAYLPGEVINMLPNELSYHLCSLMEQQDRYAIVLTLDIDDQGSVLNQHLEKAIICSHKKWSYDDATKAIEEKSCDQITTLFEVTNALHQWRKNNAMILSERPDFRVKVDEQKRPTSIVREDRNTAQKLIEEAMLVANRSVAIWMGQFERGLFNSQLGFIEERLVEIQKLSELFEKPVPEKVDSLPAFLNIMQPLEEQQRQLFQKRLTRTITQSKSTPHYALGFEAYCTFTSPIRKYNDLCIHRLIHSAIDDQTPAKLVIDDQQIEALNQQNKNVRQVMNQVEDRLRLYLIKKGDQFSATVMHATGNAMFCQLSDNGAQGQIDLRKVDKKFDALTFSHTINEETYGIGKQITVKVTQSDPVHSKLQLELVS